MAGPRHRVGEAAASNWRYTAHSFAVQAVERFGHMRPVVTLGWTFPKATPIETPRNGDAPCPRLLNRDEFVESAQDEALDLEPAFVASLSREHYAYGVVQERKLVSYEIFSRAPTAVPFGLTATFARGYLYVYKAFTRPEHRGLGLHALVTNAAAKAARREGLYGMVAYARMANRSSIRSFHRLGFRTMGIALLPQSGQRALPQLTFSGGPAWLRFTR